MLREVLLPLLRRRDRDNFAGPCDYQRTSRNYFVTRVEGRLACITSLDVFSVHEGGACFTKSVMPMEEKAGR